MDKTETVTAPGHHSALRTEIRIVRSAFSGLRGDLITGAFAFRPLPPLAPDWPPLAWTPAEARRYARWLPHVAIVVGAVLSMVVTALTMDGFYGVDMPVSVLCFGLPMLLVIFRPVGAFWLSLLGFVVVAFLDVSGTWPWLGGAMATHIAVMVVVTLRGRPRVAGEMWVLTALVSWAMPSPPWWGDDNSLVMASLSLPMMLSAALVRGWLDTRREVVAQTAVTARERSKRTLLENRTTIARELHDVVAHHMSVVAIQAEAAPYRVSDPPPELAQAFATIRENAVAALTELRRVLGVVRAEDYEAPDAPQPTLADLDGLLDNVREAGLPVEKLVVGAVRPLPQGVELSAYRIVQEALSNTLRHAPGATARVEVAYVLGGLALRVVNGPPRGEARPSPGAGHGITGMRERVAMLDGEMTTGPTADGGYETAVFLPVPAEEPS
ncbi:sensor histidine kinase [Streptomyces sp. SBT349]|uniref:sensor histidine kinase n=1 Tax=Streptomyces sp. SBT349 TaxID=1580539 RepID=UPI000AE96AB1|nr:histidine kinase [Streptomyces sp. SBT349]